MLYKVHPHNRKGIPSPFSVPSRRRFFIPVAFFHSAGASAEIIVREHERSEKMTVREWDMAETVADGRISAVPARTAPLPAVGIWRRERGQKGLGGYGGFPEGSHGQ